MKRSVVFLGSGVCFVLLLIFLSCNDRTKNNREISGTVTDLRKGKSDDIVITLEGKRDLFYIDRGIERGINIDSIRNKIYGKSVTLYCAKPSIIMKMGPMVNTIAIYQIKLGNEVIFSDFY